MAQSSSKRKSTQQILRDQLEESRAHLKRELEARMKLERQIKDTEEQVLRLTQGLQDILQVVAGLHSEEAGEGQQSQLENGSDSSRTEDGEQAVNQIISRVFAVQRAF